MYKISIKQKMVLEAIEYYISQNGYSPTYREIGKMVGMKYPNSVFSIVMRLEEKGLISTKNGKIRTIKVLKEY